MAAALAKIMKSVRIEFVPSKSWRLIWVAVALLCVSIVVLASLRWRGITSATALIEQSVLQAQDQIRQRSIREIPVAEPKQASAQQAAILLQRDLNAAFLVAENMQEPKVKLKSFNYEAATNTLRLEYELDSMARASSVTSMLNAGFENSLPWTLEAAAVIGAANGAAAGVRATWVGRLGGL